MEDGKVFISLYFKNHGKYCYKLLINCEHDIARPQVGDEEAPDVQMCKVTAVKVILKSRTCDKERASSFGVGHRASNSPP
jgi:hypothetical protein